MYESVETAALGALRQVFETAAFMSVWPWDEDESRPMPDVAATMKFYGEHKGAVTLRVNRQVLEPLVFNMLGECAPERSADEAALDALKEVLNMVCGNLLTEWFGDGPTFDLSPPEIVTAEELADHMNETATKLRFILEDTAAELIISDVDLAGANLNKS